MSNKKRKQKPEDPTVFFRCPPDLLQALDGYVAEEVERNRSGTIRHAIRLFLKSKGINASAR